VRAKLNSKLTPHPSPLPVWRGEGIGALGGSRPLPELFSAAGCQFEFSAKTIAPVAKLLREELKNVNVMKPVNYCSYESNNMMALRLDSNRVSIWCY